MAGEASGFVVRRGGFIGCMLLPVWGLGCAGTPSPSTAVVTPEPTSTATPEPTPTPADVPRIQGYRWTGSTLYGGLQGQEEGGIYTGLRLPEVYRTDEAVYLVPETAHARGIYFLDPFRSGSVADADTWLLGEAPGGWIDPPTNNALVDFDGDGRTEVTSFIPGPAWFQSMEAWGPEPSRGHAPAGWADEGASFHAFDGGAVDDACDRHVDGVDVRFAPLSESEVALRLPVGTSRCVGLFDGGFLALTDAELSLYPLSGNPTLEDRLSSRPSTDVVLGYVLADVDADGSRELLMREVLADDARGVAVRGSLSGPPSLVLGGLGGSLSAFAVGDLNGDDFEDVVVSSWSAEHEERALAIYLGPLTEDRAWGQAAYVFYPQEPVRESAIDLLVEDLNGDGRDELVFSSGDWNAGAGFVTIADWDAIVATVEP